MRDSLPAFARDRSPAESASSPSYARLPAVADHAQMKAVKRTIVAVVGGIVGCTSDTPDVLLPDSQFAYRTLEGCVPLVGRALEDGAGINCVAAVVFREPSGGASCTGYDAAFCTPGDIRCRQHGSLARLGATSVQYPVIESPDGVDVVSSAARVTRENGNLYAFDATGRRHLVCEFPQLFDSSCRENADFMSLASGWCLSDNTGVGSVPCRGGANNAMRVFGTASKLVGAAFVLHCPY